MDKPTPDLIESIASLWKLVVALGFVLALVLFRHQLRSVIERFKNLRFKRGKTEVLLEQTSSELDTKKEALQQKRSDVAPEEKDIDKGEELPKDSSSLFRSMVDAFRDKKFDEATTLFEKLNETEDNETTNKENEVLYLYLSYIYKSDKSALKRLDDLAKDQEIADYAVLWLAGCYEHSKDYQKAITIYQKAVTIAKTEDKKADYFASQASCLNKLNKSDQALELLGNALSNFDSDIAKASLYKTISSIEKERGNNEAAALAREKVAEYEPENTTARFNAAYAQGDSDLHILSALNYDTLLSFDNKDSTALNNLGAQCLRLKLPIKGIGFYRKAMEQKNTLAMSNLAYKYMNEGFSEEAASILEKAKSLDNIHPNVGSAIADLQKVKEQEEELWKKILSNGVQQQGFFRKYADRYFTKAKSSDSFEGAWILDGEHDIRIGLQKDKISAEWGEKRKIGKIEGTITNATAKLKWRKWVSGFFGNGHFDSGTDGFAYLSTDGSSIQVMTIDKTEIVFHQLVRKRE